MDQHRQHDRAAQAARPVQRVGLRGWVAACLLFAVLSACLIVLMFPSVSFWALAPSLAAFYALALVMGGRMLWQRFSKAYLLLFAMAFVLLPFAIVMRMFGYVDFMALLHHLRAGVTVDSFVESRPALVQSLGAILLYVLAVFHLGSLFRLRTTAAVAGAMALWLVNPTLWAALSATGVTTAPLGLHTRLVTPQPVAQAERPDIVLIYLEGFERGYKRTDLFGEAYAPLAELEREALVFTDIAQIDGTGWTIAGIVASQCGLPLLPNAQGNALNMFADQTDFLTAQTCLGDVLKARGYWNEYILGNDRRFAGNHHFVNSHGFDRITDLERLETVFPQPEVAQAKYHWVVDDQMVLDHARTRYLDLASRTDPFLLMVQTFGPHGPRHLVSRACREDGRVAHVSEIGPAAYCLAEQVRDFVRFVRANQGARKTVFLLMSDHLGHDPRLRALLGQDTRRNTVMMLSDDAAPRQIDRAGATIDVYPTLLDFLGLLGAEGRAGLGVSLLRNQPSLRAELGMELLNQQLRFDPAIRRAIWQEGPDMAR